MKRLLTIILICLATWLQSAAAADDGIEALLGPHLRAGKGVQGQFQQEKKLPFMQQALVSTGSFYMLDEHCLVWRVDSPAASTMVVDEGRVSLDGEAVNDRGIGRMIAMLIHGVTSGDMAQLSDQFSIESRENRNGWTLTLTPKTLLVEQAIEQIEVRGDKEVERVNILEPAGSQTIITFSGVEAFDALDDGHCSGKK